MMLSAMLWAQTPAKYWIQFRDKQGTPYSVQHPEKFLSPRAIELRRQHQIPITPSDLPVSPRYVSAVLALDSSVRLCTTSKWLNGITIYAENDSLLTQLQSLQFVVYAERTAQMNTPESFDNPFQFKDELTPAAEALPAGLIPYGDAQSQVELNNAQWLHLMGYHGENVRVMVLDGGFANVDTSFFFKKLRDEHRLLGVRNIAQPEVSPFQHHYHGSQVLSCIAAYVPNQMVGTAPMVEVYLCQTEDNSSEQLVEEDNWVAGIELADSLGCQILTSSLGYTRFDDSTHCRKYQNFDGEHSRASRAATMAVSKGMIVCNSAGNEGASSWHHIGIPADAYDILTVGAVNEQGTKAPFSSFGPTADGRVKPDVCAVGWNTTVADVFAAKTRTANGTSFSTPVLCGMIACLRQAFLNSSNYEIMDAVRQSASQYEHPDTALGYGIPDFLTAYNILKQPSLPHLKWSCSDFTASPLQIWITTPEEVAFSFYGHNGRKWKSKVTDHQIVDVNSISSHKVCYTVFLPKRKKNAPACVVNMEARSVQDTLHFTLGRKL